MSAALIGLVVVCASSSAAAALSLSGGEEKSPQPAAQPAAQPVAQPAEEPAAQPAEEPAAQPAEEPAEEPAPAQTLSSVGVLEGFSKFENLEIKYETEKCDTEITLDACKTKCNYDRDCISFTYNPEEQKCCLSTGTSDIKYSNKLVTFVKTLPEYKTVTLGDRFGGDLKEVSDKDLEGCADACDEDYKCVGFSFKKGSCLLKKEDGLGSRYSETGSQFYERKEIPADMRYKYENLANGDLIQCDADDPKGDPNNVYRWDGQRLELLPNPGIATSWDPSWRTNKQKIDSCIGIPVGNDLGVKSVSDFTGSCDDLSGAYEDVSASSLQKCGDKCRNDESSFPCGGFMWNGNTCRLYDNAWTTGVDICKDGWTAHRFNGIPQSDNFTSSYDDMSGSYNDISTDVRGCKVACQNKGGACGGFMHKDNTCRMYKDGSSTGVDIQSTGWTAYRK